MPKSARAHSNHADDALGAGMPFFEHLDELRTRIVRSLAAVGIGMGISVFEANRIGDFVLAPTLRALPPGAELVFTRPGEMVTVGLLWRHLKYAVLVMFIVAAVLTPSADPWNQTAVALPMIVLYLLGIAIAWIAQPRRHSKTRVPDDPTKLRLVVGGMVLDRAARHAQPRYNRGRWRQLC